MPEFLDEFASSVIAKKEGMKDRVLKGTPNPLQERFREEFPSYWVKIDDPAKLGVNPAELGVMAVDSSVYSNLLSPLPSETKQQAVHRARGSFWPMVRERMKEKATQLYLEDHPGIQEAPALRELRRTGYLETAKAITLKEIQAEKKAENLQA